MKSKLIQEFLKEHNIDIDDLSLGDFDYIGEYTARKTRDRSNPLYKSVGFFFFSGPIMNV